MIHFLSMCVVVAVGIPAFILLLRIVLPAVLFVLGVPAGAPASRKVNVLGETWRVVRQYVEDEAHRRAGEALAQQSLKR